MTEPCTRCGNKIDPETPIQIGDPLICDICTDDINTPMTEEQKDREEQQINKNDSKFMTITKFAWDEKANQVKTLQQQNEQLKDGLKAIEVELAYLANETTVKQVVMKMIDDLFQQIQGNGEET